MPTPRAPARGPTAEEGAEEAVLRDLLKKKEAEVAALLSAGQGGIKVTLAEREVAVLTQRLSALMKRREHAN